MPLFPRSLVGLPSPHVCRLVNLEDDAFLNGAAGRISEETYEKLNAATREDDNSATVLNPHAAEWRPLGAENLSQNGTIATKLSKEVLSSTASSLREEPFLVAIDGQPGLTKVYSSSQIQILPKSSIPYDPQSFNIGFGVGRNSLRDTSFHAISAVMAKPYNTAKARGKLCDENMGGKCMRVRGNLAALKKTLENGNVPPYNPSKPLPLILMPTDLNVARALNGALQCDTRARLAREVQEDFNHIVGMLDDLGYVHKDHPNVLALAKFEPIRVLPDRFGARHGLARYESVKRGSFHIYPCPHPFYYDAWEVRYLALDGETIGAAKTEIYCPQDIFLDYGKEEVFLYARNAIALGEDKRLLPFVLADVDPQVFWAILLRLDDFLALLQNQLNRPDIADVWNSLKAGIKISRELCETVSTENNLQCTFHSSPNHWVEECFPDETRHEEESTKHAIMALHQVCRHSCSNTTGTDTSCPIIEMKKIYESGHQNVSRIITIAREIGEVDFTQLVSC